MATRSDLVCVAAQWMVANSNKKKKEHDMLIQTIKEFQWIRSELSKYLYSLFSIWNLSLESFKSAPFSNMFRQQHEKKVLSTSRMIRAN